MKHHDKYCWNLLETWNTILRWLPTFAVGLTVGIAGYVAGRGTGEEKGYTKGYHSGSHQQYNEGFTNGVQWGLQSNHIHPAEHPMPKSKEEACALSGEFYEKDETGRFKQYSCYPIAISGLPDGCTARRLIATVGSTGEVIHSTMTICDPKVWQVNQLLGWPTNSDLRGWVLPDPQPTGPVQEGTYTVTGEVNVTIK